MLGVAEAAVCAGAVFLSGGGADFGAVLTGGVFRSGGGADTEEFGVDAGAVRGEGADGAPSKAGSTKSGDAVWSCASVV